MVKFISTKYTNGGFNIGLFLLRVGLGLMLLAQHGLPKLEHFNERAANFYNFLHLGSHLSLILAIFAEVFCSIFVILGLFTRWAIIPLLIQTAVIALIVDRAGGFGSMELATHYFLGFLVILILGPGKISLDRLVLRK